MGLTLSLHLIEPNREASKPIGRPFDGVLLVQSLHRLLLHERQQVRALRVREEVFLGQDPPKSLPTHLRRKPERKTARDEFAGRYEIPDNFL